MLLNKEQIAARFGTSSDLARATLADNGVLPIDFGRGKGRGPRWLSEAVDAVILKLHKEAQDRVAPRKKKLSRVTCAPLSSLSTADIYKLTKSHSIQ